MIAGSGSVITYVMHASRIRSPRVIAILLVDTKEDSRRVNQIDDIFWHDCKIRRVIEIPAEDRILIEVDYPIDWDHNRFEPRVISFSGVRRYEIREGAFVGAPTILKASAIPSCSFGFSTIRIGTNAGERLIECEGIELHLCDA